MHIDLVTKWGVGQEAELVAEITQLTGVILVFWEHKSIANGDHSGGRGCLPWIVNFSPRLLKGDSDEPFARRET